MTARVRRFLRFLHALARHPGLPRWLRRTVVVLVFAPIPGPFDELAAVLLLAVICVVRRPVVRECWEATR